MGSTPRRALGPDIWRACPHRGYFFFGGTFFPSRRAFESPIAIACLGFVTFLPLWPDLSWPFFISFISVSTFLPADGEYFRPEDFFEDVFLAEDFLVLLLRRVLVFVALEPLREEVLEELLFFALLELFFAAFFVAMCILPRKSDVRWIRVSCMANERIMRQRISRSSFTDCATQRGVRPSRVPADRRSSSTRRTPVCQQPET